MRPFWVSKACEIGLKNGFSAVDRVALVSIQQQSAAIPNFVSKIEPKRKETDAQFDESTPKTLMHGFGRFTLAQRVLALSQQ